MTDLNFDRTPEREKELHDTITRRVTTLERANYKKKKLTRTEMQKKIKRIIEEEVTKA